MEIYTERLDLYLFAVRKRKVQIFFKLVFGILVALAHHKQIIAIFIVVRIKYGIAVFVGSDNAFYRHCGIIVRNGIGIVVTDCRRVVVYAIGIVYEISA